MTKGTTSVGDPEIIAEALDVLIGNAAYFCEEGGRIECSLSSITNDQVCLRFFNTGSALPEGFRLDGTANESTHHGNGVGLADIFTNLALMEADIRAQNEKDGVAFYVTFKREQRDMHSVGTPLRGINTNPSQELLPTGTEG